MEFEYLDTHDPCMEGQGEARTTPRGVGARAVASVGGATTTSGRRGVVGLRILSYYNQLLDDHLDISESQATSD